MDKPHDENLASSCLQWRKPYIPYFTVIFLFSYAHRLGLPRCVLGWPRFENVKMTFKPFFSCRMRKLLMSFFYSCNFFQILPIFTFADFLIYPIANFIKFLRFHKFPEFPKNYQNPDFFLFQHEIDQK